MKGLDKRMARVNEKNEKVQEIIDWFRETSADPAELNPHFEAVGSSPMKQKVKMDQVITRPNIQINDMAVHMPLLKDFLANYDDEIVQLAETNMKYASYIVKEMEMVNRVSRLEEMKLQPDFDYSTITSLSLEAREKLNKHKPASLGQAGRISGINPADISVLLVHLK